MAIILFNNLSGNNICIHSTPMAQKVKKKKKEGEIERAIYRPINGIVNCKKSTTSVKVNIPDGDV